MRIKTPDTPTAAAGSSPADACSVSRHADLRPHLSYAFVAGQQRGAALANPLFELLAALLEGGSIRHAARNLGRSYRYVWDALHRWEQVLQSPLVTWAQGQKARPTEFAQKLLWAERRARTRMQPHIEALRPVLPPARADAAERSRQHPANLLRSRSAPIALRQSPIRIGHSYAG